MRINIKKTEYMECGPQTHGTIIIDGEKLPKEACFKYLGSTNSADGIIPALVNVVWMKWPKVTGVLCDAHVSNQ